MTATTTATIKRAECENYDMSDEFKRETEFTLTVKDSADEAVTAMKQLMLRLAEGSADRNNIGNSWGGLLLDVACLKACGLDNWQEPVEFLKTALQRHGNDKQVEQALAEFADDNAPVFTDVAAFEWSKIGGYYFGPEMWWGFLKQYDSDEVRQAFWDQMQLIWEDWTPTTPEQWEMFKPQMLKVAEEMELKDGFIRLDESKYPKWYIDALKQRGFEIKETVAQMVARDRAEEDKKNAELLDELSKKYPACQPTYNEPQEFTQYMEHIKTVNEPATVDATGIRGFMDLSFSKSNSYYEDKDDKTIALDRQQFWNYLLSRLQVTGSKVRANLLAATTGQAVYEALNPVLNNGKWEGFEGTAEGSDEKAAAPQPLEAPELETFLINGSLQKGDLKQARESIEAIGGTFVAELGNEVTVIVNCPNPDYNSGIYADFAVQEITEEVFWLTMESAEELDDAVQLAIEEANFEELFEEADKYKAAIIKGITDIAANFCEENEFLPTGKEPQWLIDALKGAGAVFDGEGTQEDDSDDDAEPFVFDPDFDYYELFELCMSDGTTEPLDDPESYEEFVQALKDGRYQPGKGISPKKENNKISSVDEIKIDSGLLKQFKALIFERATASNPEVHALYRRINAMWCLNDEVPGDLLPDLDPILKSCAEEAGIDNLSIEELRLLALKHVIASYGNPDEVFSLAKELNAYDKALAWVGRAENYQYTHREKLQPVHEYRPSKSWLHRVIKLQEGDNAEAVLDSIGLNLKFSAFGHVVLKEMPLEEIVKYMADASDPSEGDNKVAYHWEDMDPITIGELRRWEPDGNHEITFTIKPELFPEWLERLPDAYDKDGEWVRDIFYEPIGIRRRKGQLQIAMEMPMWGMEIELEALLAIICARCHLKSEWIENYSCDG